jgi:hypothetical protein
MVDPKWESASGHAIASARYGALSWQLPAEKPPLPQGPVDERAEALRQSYEAERERWEAEAFDRWEAGLPW